MSAVNHVFSLTITGGEPSMNADAIWHLRNSVRFHDCSLDCFWLAINAAYFKQGFYDAIQELYSICLSKGDCSMTISGDQYHGKMSSKALDMYSELPFFSDAWLHRRIDTNQLLDEGMAQRNGIGRKEKIDVQVEITDFSLTADSLYIGDLVYINAKGDVLLDCDLSFVRQKQYVIGNVLNEALEQILLRNLKKEKSAA